MMKVLKEMRILNFEKMKIILKKKFQKMKVEKNENQLKICEK